MSSLPNVALIGATGNLGSAILTKLLAAKLQVTILTRKGSKSTANLPSHPNQTIKEADYSSKESLTAALKGVEVVVSTVSTASVNDQKLLIDSALATGTVTRFIPSEFGSDITHPKNANLPVFAGKTATAKYLEEVSAAHPNFTYTAISNNVFFDWGIKVGFIINAKQHTATLWDGGDRPFSTTRLSTIGDAVVAVINNLPGTANKLLRIHDAQVTQNQLIEIVKKIDGQVWNTTFKSIQENEQEMYAELKKPEPDFGKAMLGFLPSAVYGEGREVFASQIDNELLGLKTLSKAEVEEVVKAVVQS